MLQLTRRASTFAVLASIAVAAVAGHAFLDPFDETVHSWAVGAGAAFAAFALAWFGMVGIRSGERLLSPSAVAAFGGALAAADLVAALLAVGSPQRVPVAPGQRYRAPHGSVELILPPFSAPAADARIAPSDGSALRHLPYDALTRVGPYVFVASHGPAASVAASSARGEPQTVTQPDNVATFVSPYLTFGIAGGAHPQDVFDVNALHRRIHVDYYPGLPARGIEVPFLLLQVSEQNGGVVFEGVAVSDRDVRAPGIRLRFHLTSYPVLDMSSAPQLLPLLIGCALVLAGASGGGFIALRRALERPASPTV